MSQKEQIRVLFSENKGSIFTLDDVVEKTGILRKSVSPILSELHNADQFLTVQPIQTDKNTTVNGYSFRELCGTQRPLQTIGIIQPPREAKSAPPQEMQDMADNIKIREENKQLREMANCVRTELEVAGITGHQSVFDGLRAMAKAVRANREMQLELQSYRARIDELANEVANKDHELEIARVEVSLLKNQVADQEDGAEGEYVVVQQLLVDGDIHDREADAVEYAFKQTGDDGKRRHIFKAVGQVDMTPTFKRALK